jgi:uncharacterized membrane protein YuzA (DUF378 family)
MTRHVALRAGGFFSFLTVLFGALLHVGTNAPITQALFLIVGSLCALMLVFAYATPDHAAAPVRARRSHHR